MHSRIFQVSKAPINKEDYITEYDYFDHWFTNYIADYVNGNTDREYDIEWLRECYQNSLTFGIDEYGEYFVIGDKHEFFAEKFKVFKDALEKLTKITIEDFVDGTYGMDMTKLTSSYDDDCGFYIESNEYGLNTIDDFIRHRSIGDKFYIGATIDYHF